MIIILLQKAARDRSGNVAVLFALCALGMIGLVGIAIDTSRAMAVKTTLDASADAAALAAVTQAETTLQTTSGGTTAAVSQGKTVGTNVFTANATRVGTTIGGTPTPTVTVTQSTVNAKQVLTAVVSYQANSPNAFGPIFGSNNTPLSGTSTSSLTLPSYMNISVAIDISQSMGLAATAAGQSQLVALTGVTQCAFGCHAYQTGQSGTQPYEVQAHNANPAIDLRIDVIKSATQSMITTAQNLTVGTPLINFAIYTFGTNLSTISSSSSNYSSLNTSVGAIDLDNTTDTNGYGDTGATLAAAGATTPMQTLTNNIPANGDGSSASAAQQYLFIMTDGVEDIHTADSPTCKQQQGVSAIYAWQWGHCTSTFDPTQCQALKNRNVIVGVIYTTYLQMPSSNQWTTLVQPFTGSIAPAMKSCATPGWYYEATQASDIQAAVNALFAQATGHGILTQ